VSCTHNTYSDAGTSNVNIYQFTALATFGQPSAAGYVERSVSASLEY